MQIATSGPCQRPMRSWNLCAERPAHRVGPRRNLPVAANVCEHDARAADAGRTAIVRHAGRQSLEAKADTDDQAIDIVKVRKRQGRSQETRNKILAAATAEFSTSGFDGSTSRSIAERAEVPHGLVIYHFETKLGIWRAVMEKAITDFHNELAGEAERHRDSDAVTALRALQRVFVHMAAARPELNWLISHEMGRESDRLSWLLEKIAGRDIDLAIDLIRRAQREGRFIAGDPAHLHFLFVGAASRVFLMPTEIQRTMGCSPFDEAFLDQHLALCQSLFFRDPDRTNAP